ncbi:MAG: LacI family transcriptional regulator [Propionibacteriaceae bacterium]|jgi:LacI family transcriptional regulator|nr:LacI family transcriptional regulator [Propionibacteriaceae bacterium]
MTERRYPTLADIAERAQVSVATVGRALQEKPKNTVRPEVVERVRDIARQFGYVPNAAARSLRGASPATVGLIIGDMLDPYFGQIGAAVTEEANSLSKLALVANIQRDPLRELEWCERLWHQRVGGLILAGGGFDQNTYQSELKDLLDRMIQSGTRVIALSHRNLGIPYISVDNGQVGRLAAHRVLHAGHRRIGLVFGPESLATRERVVAIEEHLERGGARWTRLSGGYNASAGAEAADLFMQSPQPPTAIVAGSDSIAVGCQQRLFELGYQVPTDVSVTSIGATILGRMATPRIASVDLKTTAAGRAAVRHLFSEDPDDLPTLSAELVEGSSLGLLAAER